MNTTAKLDASPDEYVSGVQKLERRDADSKRFIRSKSKVPGGLKDQGDSNTSDDGVAPAYGPTSPGEKPIDYETWGQMGFKTHMTFPYFDKETGEVVALVHGSEDAKLCKSILEKSPGPKRGRPKKTDKASNTQRSRKHRAKHRKAKHRKEKPENEHD